MLVALACALAVIPPASAKTPAKRQSSHHRDTKRKQLARLRADLARQVKRNPTVVFTRTFAHAADVANFRLPMTVRLAAANGSGGYLASDDQLEVAWDDSVILWPLAGFAPAGPQTLALDGGFTMEALFAGDASGYGEPGSMETFQGARIDMTAGPFAISEFDPTCPNGPHLATQPSTSVTISSAGGRYGMMNMFSKQMRGSLNLRFRFASAITGTCGGATDVTTAVDNSGAPPMPVHFDGTFQVSPAVTADGRMRFGRIVVDDSVTPQTSTFAYVRACTTTNPGCDPVQFPARLKVKKLVAEVLLGDLF